MKWVRFHHPDVSLPVIRRRVTDELLDALDALGTSIRTRGWSSVWGSSYPSQTAYRSAMYRLEQRGLITYRRTDGGPPVLELTDEGRARRPGILKPQKYWSREWTGRWNVLVYDVPESERGYRAALRGFLRQMRMGCLQGSVWVSPDDIRPDYADLARAGGLSGYAFLFESHTVLGQRDTEVSCAAWDFRRLGLIQATFCNTYEQNLELLNSGEYPEESLVALLREESASYLAALHDDPLLPRSLWPLNYHGPAVYDLHQRLTRALRDRLRLKPPRAKA